MLISRLARLAFCLHGFAFAQEVPTYAGDDGTKYGRAQVVVQPEYPADALRERKSGAVVVSGAVDPRGEMRSPALVPDGEGSSVFVEPLRQALRSWSFYTPVERDCMPSSRAVKVRVEFKADDGRPHVYLVYAAADTMPYEDWPPIKPLEAPRLRYPRAMLDDGVEAVAYARAVVDAGGRVGEVATQAYPKQGDAVRLEPFNREVRAGLAGLRFAPDSAHATRYVCYTVEFNLRK